MNAAQRADFIERFIEEKGRKVMASKGRSYSRGEEDVNSNFKRVAADTGLTPLQVAFVYYLKHKDAVSHFVITGEESSEGVFSNLGDMMNYTLILASLIQESRDTAGLTAQEVTDQVAASMPWGLNKPAPAKNTEELRKAGLVIDVTEDGLLRADREWFDKTEAERLGGGL